MPRAPTSAAIRTRRVALALLCAVSGCGPNACRVSEEPVTEDTATLQRRGCPSFEVKQTGAVQGNEIDEASGLAAATTLPGAFWVHNDSGDEPRLYALSRQGALLGVVDIQGAEAEDWEDMAAAPGKLDATRDLILGDVGDNFRRRETVQLYRLPEPSAGQLGGAVRATRYDVQWPDGPRDVEALFADPLDGSVYLVEKSLGRRAIVFRVKLEDVPPTPKEVARIPLRLVTAADMSPDGARIVFRNYQRALLYERIPGQTVDQALATRPCPVTLPDEPQGEAIAFADPHTLLSLSEKSNQPVYVLRQIPQADAPEKGSMDRGEAP